MEMPLHTYILFFFELKSSFKKLIKVHLDSLTFISFQENYHETVEIYFYSYHVIPLNKTVIILSTSFFEFDCYRFDLSYASLLTK